MRLYRQRLASLTPSERLTMAFDMFDCARELVRSGIRHRNPGATPAEVEQQLFLRFYGRDFSPERTAVILERIAAAHRPDPPPAAADRDS